jgi:hypothetical protein
MQLIHSILIIIKFIFKDLMNEENGFYDKWNDKCKFEFEFSILKN